MSLGDILVHRVLKVNCAPDWHWKKQPVYPFPAVYADAIRDKYFWNNNLWCILGGSGTIKTGQSQWSLSRGDVFLLRGNEAYFATHDPSRPLIVIAVHFDFTDKSRNILTPDGLPFHRHFTGMQFVESLLKRITIAWRSGQAETSAIWMRVCLNEFISAEKQISDDRQNDKAEIIRAICDEIRSNPGRQYVIADFARRTHCSLRHFNRLFKQFAGTTAHEYILTARLETAKDIILSSSHSISRIAELVGFNDIYYFSKWFKIKTGLPPSEYRRSKSLED